MCLVLLQIMVKLFDHIYLPYQIIYHDWRRCEDLQLSESEKQCFVD